MMYNTLIIIKPFRLHEQICWKHKKMAHFLRCFHIVVNLYSKKVDKLSKGSNSNFFRNGSILIYIATPLKAIFKVLKLNQHYPPLKRLNLEAKASVEAKNDN